MMQSIAKQKTLIKYAEHQKRSLQSRRFVKFLPQKRAESVKKCGSYLLFTQWKHIDSCEKIITLSQANFCKHRLCLMCQWRKSIKTASEFLAKLKEVQLQREHKDFSVLMLTLSAPNSQISELRDTVKKMSRAWNNFINYKPLKAMQFGWFRAVEFLGSHTKDGEAHPHFHCLLLVNKSYFTDKTYLSQRELQNLWSKALAVAGIEGGGIVNVKKITTLSSSGFCKDLSLINAVVNVVKYSQKPSSVDALSDSDLKEFMAQIKGLIQYSYGGALKRIKTEKLNLRDYIKEVALKYRFEDGIYKPHSFWQRKKSNHLPQATAVLSSAVESKQAKPKEEKVAPQAVTVSTPITCSASLQTPALPQLESKRVEASSTCSTTTVSSPGEWKPSLPQAVTVSAVPQLENNAIEPQSVFLERSTSQMSKHIPAPATVPKIMSVAPICRPRPKEHCSSLELSAELTNLNR